MQRLLETPESSQRARSLLLSSAPDPETATHYLDKFERAHPESASRVSDSATGLQSLVAVFSYSNFLSEELLQHPEWIEQTAGSPDLYRTLPPEEMRQRLDEFLGPPEGLPSALPLAVFRRRQLLRILLRDVLGHATLSEITEELSNVADAILRRLLPENQERTHQRSRHATIRRPEWRAIGMRFLGHRARQAWRTGVELQL